MIDKTTLDAILTTLPDASTYPENEYYRLTSYIDKILDKIVEARVHFKKDNSGKNWVYVGYQTKKDSA